MCGIVGFIACEKGMALGRDQLCAMRDCMIHRGPDDAVIEVYEGGDVVVGLGH